MCAVYVHVFARIALCSCYVIFSAQGMHITHLGEYIICRTLYCNISHITRFCTQYFYINFDLSNKNWCINIITVNSIIQYIHYKVSNVYCNKLKIYIYSYATLVHCFVLTGIFNVLVHIITSCWGIGDVVMGHKVNLETIYINTVDSDLQTVQK